MKSMLIILLWKEVRMKTILCLLNRSNASESANPVHNYSINDQLYNVNSNIVYYRLRIVDKDGKYTYSKVVPVKLEQPENIISVYPNPVDNYTTLNLFADKAGTGMLRVIDNAGKQTHGQIVHGIKRKQQYSD